MDLKLVFRMLVKYPGLTLVGGLAMAFAIAVGAAAFEAVDQVVSPTLPLDEGDVSAVVARLHTIAASIDPRLRLHNVARMSDGDPTMWMEFEFLFKLLMLVSGIALLLSLAGIYAAMSFAVSRRTREIGIRMALGATAVRVATATFARPFGQVGLGVLIGAGLTSALVYAVTGGVSATGVGLVTAYAAAMLGVCLLPSITPLGRALRVDPTGALKGDG